MCPLCIIFIIIYNYYIHNCIYVHVHVHVSPLSPCILHKIPSQWPNLKLFLDCKLILKIIEIKKSSLICSMGVNRLIGGVRNNGVPSAGIYAAKVQACMYMYMLMCMHMYNCMYMYIVIKISSTEVFDMSTCAFLSIIISTTVYKYLQHKKLFQSHCCQEEKILYFQLPVIIALLHTCECACIIILIIIIIIIIIKANVHFLVLYRFQQRESIEN